MNRVGNGGDMDPGVEGGEGMARDMAESPADGRGLLEQLLDEVEGQPLRPTGGQEVSFPGAELGDTSPSGQTMPSSASPPQGLGLDPALQNAVAKLWPALLGSMTASAGREDLSQRAGSPHGEDSARGEAAPRPMDRHTALLCALRPYLSPRRREAAQTLLRLCGVWDAIEASGLSLKGLSGLLGGGGPLTDEGRSDHVQ